MGNLVRAVFVGVMVVLPCALAAVGQAVLTWDQVLVETSRLEAAGKDVEASSLLERFVQSNPKRYEPYVALAHLYEKQGKFAEAADAVRHGRQAVPDMPATFVLQLIQYDVQQVTASPTLPRADAARLLQEATAVADELIAARQEVRFAMMAKSLALKLQAERLEQAAERRQALMAESNRLAEKARFTAADGSAIAKTVDDEWLEVLGAGPTPMSPPPALLEKFVAAHPDFFPARMALGTHHQDLGDNIKDRTAAARLEHYRAADVQFTRAVAVAQTPADAAAALGARIDLLGPERLDRRAEAEALARSAVTRYPDQAMPVISLARLLAPPGTIPTEAALRSLRTAVPATAEAQQALGVYLREIVAKNKDLPRADAARVLSEATASFDAALRVRPGYADAMVYKALVLRLQAERVEQDPARVKALRAEADRLSAQARKMLSGGR